ncbi:MAG TPA: hypothetical protein EYG98_05290 [Sulfurovum sp.]|nr:hypothetical protein [Sulfurovum sp.]
MKTIKTLAIVAISGLIATSTLDASMDDGPRGVRGMHKNPIIKIIKKLDLTEEQKTALKKTRKTMVQDTKSRIKTINQERDISKFVTVDGFDKVGFIQEAGANAKSIAKLRADMFEKTFDILTPEQRLEFIDLLGKTRKNRR